MSEIFNKSTKTKLFITCIMISLFLTAGCVSQVSPSNSSADSNNLIETRVLDATNGTYSINATVPLITGNIMTYIVEKPDYSQGWVNSLAKKLGMCGDVRENEFGFYANTTDEEKFFFILEKKTQRLVFTSHDEGSSGNLTDDEAITVVKDFLKSADLMSDAGKPRVVYGPGDITMSRSGQITQKPKQIVLVFSRRINGLPVWGSTSMITVGSGGNISNIFMVWPDYQPYKTVSLISPEQAFGEFQNKKLVFLNGEPQLRPEKIIVTNVSLGYSTFGGKYFRPVYLFGGYEQRGNDTQQFNPVEIPATNEALE
jgi:hypothetical protein